MTIGKWLSAATVKLKQAGLPLAHLDALVLLEDALKKDRAWVLAHPETDLKPAKKSTLDKQIKRRATHEPLAYIRGKSEFYGRQFKISSETLQPRPETETIIDQLKQLPLPKSAVLADVGTGSGCIAITAKLEFPDAEICATEISKDALKVARQNARKHKIGIGIYEGSLLKPLEKKAIDVVLANLPYVPESHTINKAAMFEPKSAIFGGVDGLSVYRDMFYQINGLETKPKYIITESLPYQHQELAINASLSRYRLINTEDFVQVFESVL